MSLQPKTSSVKSGVVIWQKVFETAQGGFTIDQSGITAIAGVIPAGTPVLFDESTRLVKVLKTAEVSAVASGSATTYQVKKGHSFKVGDNVGRLVGGAAYAITAIDTSNANYDTITVATTLGAAAVGAGLFQSSANGATAAALAIAPNGLTYDEFEVGKDDFIDVVLRGTVYARRIPAQQPSVKAAIPQINFSNAF